MNLNGLTHLISSIKHNKPAKFFGYFPDVLDPIPYKQQDTSTTASQSPAAPLNDSKLAEKRTTSHKTGQFCTPGNTQPNSPVAASEHYISTSATPSFIIHAQTVIVNNYPSTNSLIGKNGTTIFGTTGPTSPKNRAKNLEDLCQVPASPTTPAMPPQDLSGLRSCCCPFSSLQRHSRWHQSMPVPVQGHNWNSNLHFKDLSQSLQAFRWIPPVHYH